VDLSHGVFVVGGSHSQRARHYIHLIKSPFLIVSIRTSSRRIPASASTNQRPRKGDLIVVGTACCRMGLDQVVGVRRLLLSRAYPRSGVRPFLQTSTCPTQFTLGPWVVQIFKQHPQSWGQRNLRTPPCGAHAKHSIHVIQGYLAHKKLPPPPGPP